jgi:CO/xanthine dehydrogenase FAD-binding subunit
VTARYVAPTTVANAAAALNDDPTARLIAGGTDLIVGTRSRRTPPVEALVSLHAVDELRGLAVQPSGALWIGALTTHAALLASPEVNEGWTALADAAALVGSPATRNAGTIGGNIMNASPAMELGSPLLVFEADVELQSSTQQRQLHLEELLTGPGRTGARAGEILVGVTVARPRSRSGSAYVRLEYRQAMEIAVVGAAALVTLAEGDDVIEEARIGLTAVAPVCLRSRGAEQLLAGKGLTQTVLAEVGRAAAEEASPIADVRAPAEYRRAMIPVIVTRALLGAARRAAGECVTVPAVASPLVRRPFEGGKQ